MQILKKSKKHQYICTLAIGNKILSDWKKYSLPFLKLYCQNNDIGLILFDKDLIDKKSPNWKKATWQKLLIPNYLKQSRLNVNNICMMDVDVLVNPAAPNIFDFHIEDKVTVISLRQNLPFEWSKAVRNVSFYRNTFYSKKYPLDSAINISLENLYKNHKLKIQKDEFCAGIYVVNINKFYKKFKKWFFKYSQNLYSITGGGEQTHFNYEVLNNKKVNFIDYKFQAIWVFEMAIYYPFLYEIKSLKNNQITNAIVTSLKNNYFLHFAGTWHEGQMWKNKKIFKVFTNNFQKNLEKYQKVKLSGNPKGMIKPNIK